jgi:hypothetical protein
MYWLIQRKLDYFLCAMLTIDNIGSGIVLYSTDGNFVETYRIFEVENGEIRIFNFDKTMQFFEISGTIAKTDKISITDLDWLTGSMVTLKLKEVVAEFELEWREDQQIEMFYQAFKEYVPIRPIFVD